MNESDKPIRPANLWRAASVPAITLMLLLSAACSSPIMGGATPGQLDSMNLATPPMLPTSTTAKPLVVIRYPARLTPAASTAAKSYYNNMFMPEDTLLKSALHAPAFAAFCRRHLSEATIVLQPGVIDYDAAADRYFYARPEVSPLPQVLVDFATIGRLQYIDGRPELFGRTFGTYKRMMLSVQVPAALSPETRGLVLVSNYRRTDGGKYLHMHPQSVRVDDPEDVYSSMSFNYPEELTTGRSDARVESVEVAFLGEVLEGTKDRGLFVDQRPWRPGSAIHFDLGIVLTEESMNEPLSEPIGDKFRFIPYIIGDALVSQPGASDLMRKYSKLLPAASSGALSDSVLRDFYNAEVNFLLAQSKGIEDSILQSPAALNYPELRRQEAQFAREYGEAQETRGWQNLAVVATGLAATANGAWSPDLSNAVNQTVMNNEIARLEQEALFANSVGAAMMTAQNVTVVIADKEQTITASNLAELRQKFVELAKSAGQ